MFDGLFAPSHDSEHANSSTLTTTTNNNNNTTTSGSSTNSSAVDNNVSLTSTVTAVGGRIGGGGRIGVMQHGARLDDANGSHRTFSVLEESLTEGYASGISTDRAARTGGQSCGLPQDTHITCIDHQSQLEQRKAAGERKLRECQARLAMHSDVYGRLRVFSPGVSAGFTIHEASGEVLGVDSGGIAEQLGVLPGDRVTWVDDKPYTYEHLTAAMANQELTEVWFLRVPEVSSITIAPRRVTQRGQPSQRQAKRMARGG
jgi:hypothetical protein